MKLLIVVILNQVTFQFSFVHVKKNQTVAAAVTLVEPIAVNLYTQPSVSL